MNNIKVLSELVSSGALSLAEEGLHGLPLVMRLRVHSAHF